MLLVITDCFCMFVSVAVGVAVATVVAGVVAVFASTFPFLALPTVAIGLTTLVGIGMRALIEATGFPGWAKAQLNRLFSGY
ncbi:MAG TPA: hypothetical protein ENJ54_11760 [Chloroflexi bacterium]|nr:hypothetical protein [Chloroflexota bacterium]